MSLVLAVEPDAQQAEMLRRILGRQDDTELVVVGSAYAATSMMRRRVPDLVLLGASLGSKAQEIIDIFHLVSNAPNPQTLNIPRLSAARGDSRGQRLQRRKPDAVADAEVFAAEIAACLARAEKPGQQPLQATAPPADVQTTVEGVPIAAAAETAAVKPDIEPIFGIAPVEPREDAVAGQPAATPETQIYDKSILINLDAAVSDGKAVDPEVHAAHVAFVQARAEARLAADVERVRREAAEQRAADLARLQQEAEAQRQEEVAQARAAAVAEARDALSEELARIRSEAEDTLAAELARVRAEAAQRLADQLAEADRARAAAVEAARADAEQAATQAREAEAARRAQQQAQVDLEAIRDAATREAHAAAEAAAARALEAEVQRVRADADARLRQELACVREEAEQTREAREQAQREADAAREAAVREAIAAAEAAAASASEAEIARVRADAEARLRAELERVREDAERARLAGESEVEQIRRETEQEALAGAAATIEAEIARARAEADARLAAEVASVRADAQHRRDAERAEMRAQLAEMHDIARTHARAAAARAISEEVARATITVSRAARVAARVGSRTAGATIRAAGVVRGWLVRSGRAALPVVRHTWERLPARVRATAAILLLVVGAGAFIDLSSVAALVTSSARSASRAAATLLTGATQAVRSSLVSRETTRPVEPPADTANDAPQEPVTRDAPATAGMLAVFSRVPLDLYVSGRRIGTTQDGEILVPPGRYRVGLVNSRLNYRGEVTLDVRPAEVTAYTVSLPNGRLQVNTEPGAEVWVEGVRTGVAPLDPVPVPIGTREILVRHPALGERREYVEVRYGEIAEVSINRRETVDPATAYPLPRLDQPGARIR